MADLRITGVAKDRIVRATTPGLWAVSLLLSREPERSWSEAFHAAYKREISTAKRGAAVGQREITLQVRDGDDLQAAVDVVKRAVEKANELYRQHEAKVQEAGQQVAKRMREQEEIGNRIREQAEKLQL